VVLERWSASRIHAGVVLEGGAAVGMAESSCHGAQVHAGGDEFGGVEVAQFVPAGRDAQRAGQMPVPLCDCRGPSWGEPVKGRGEQERVLGQGDAGLRCLL
jgi:hypothetical protein